MKAFVKTNNGTFPNLNFYMAWEGFNTMGYSVTCFEEKDIDTLDITTETPVFAGVTVFKKVLDKLGIDYKPFDCYPDVLKPYYRRDIRKSTFGVEKEKFLHGDGPSVFVKPVLPKQFIGNVWTTILNMIPLANVPTTAEVWVCNPIEILSEFRVYVHDGDILGVKHYHGDWDIVPSKKFVEDVVKAYKPCPIAYGIDIGVNDVLPAFSSIGGFNWYDSSFVIEANDGCNLGNYGIDSIHYGEMIVDRWFQIVSTPKIEKYVDKAFKEAYEIEKEYGDKYDWSKHAVKHREEWYLNRNEYNGKTFDSGKERMIKDEMIKKKELALKAYADEIRETLKEETEI